MFFFWVGILVSTESFGLGISSCNALLSETLHMNGQYRTASSECYNFTHLWKNANTKIIVGILFNLWKNKIKSEVHIEKNFLFNEMVNNSIDVCFFLFPALNGQLGIAINFFFQWHLAVWWLLHVSSCHLLPAERCKSITKQSIIATKLWNIYARHASEFNCICVFVCAARSYTIKPVKTYQYEHSCVV